MKYITIFILLLTAANVFGQVVRTSSVVLTAGVPAHTPTAQGAAVALDTVAGLLYIWDQGAWGRAAVTPSQLSDSLAAIPIAVDTATFLVSDTILVYRRNGVEIRRDTIRAGALKGNGIAGYLPQYNSASTLDTTGLFWDSANGRLGIKQDSPEYALDVTGDEQTSMRLRRTGGGSATYIRYEHTAYPAWFVGQETNEFIFYGSSAYRMRINTLGNVAIGTNFTPVSNTRLAVRGAGTTSATTALRVENGAGTELMRVIDSGPVVMGGISYTLGYNHVAQRYGFGNGAYPGLNFGYIRSSANGVISLVDAAETSFNRLSWGPSTVSNPAIKKNGINLEVKLGDDTFGAGLSVGGALAASAILEAASTTQGFLPPRMTTAQRDAIASPALGLQMVSLTDSLPYMWNGSQYIPMAADGTGTDTSGYNISLTYSDDTLRLTDGNSTLEVEIPLADSLAAVRADFPVNTDNQDLSIEGSGPDYTIAISGGDDVTISAGQNITLSEPTANTLQIAVDQTLASGTYTPTGVDSLNVSSTVKHPANYLRVGNSVTVSGLVFVTPTGAGNCYIELTVPVASNFATIYDAQGVYQDIDDHFGGGVHSIAASDAVRIQFTAPDNSEHPISYHYTYRIQ